MVAHNAEKWIQESIGSIFEIIQRKDCEFVFVDDGSTDGTLIEVERMLKNTDCDQIQIIKQKNLGTAVGRNLAIEIAKGEWIYFLDGDDYVQKDNFVQVLEGLDQVKASVLRTEWKDHTPFYYHDYKKEIQVGMSIYLQPLMSISQKQLFVRSKGFWRYFYRSDFLRKLGNPFSPTFQDVGGRYILDDYYFLVRVADNLNSFAETDISTYVYRDRREGVSENYLQQIEREGLAMQIFLNHLGEQSSISKFISEEMYYRFKVVSKLLIENQRNKAHRFNSCMILGVIMNCQQGKFRKLVLFLAYFTKSL